jgi:ABC-type multidrug transport system ATPase subunit
MFEVKNVSKSLSHSSDEQPLLVVNNFNLRLGEGELITIFGPNGAGKSTK